MHVRKDQVQQDEAEGTGIRPDHGKRFGAGFREEDFILLLQVSIQEFAVHKFILNDQDPPFPVRVIQVRYTAHGVLSVHGRFLLFARSPSGNHPDIPKTPVSSCLPAVGHSCRVAMYDHLWTNYNL